MRVITFRYDVPLEQTLEFESVYPEALQLELSDKSELRHTFGSIFVWMFVDGEIAGESYGTPIAGPSEFMDGLDDLPETEKKNSFHCYSNTILPLFQKQGLGTVLKAHWLGLVAGHGFTTVYGHARPGASQALNRKFGAVFFRGFPDWYGTGEEYGLYRLVLKGIDLRAGGNPRHAG